MKIGITAAAIALTTATAFALPLPPAVTGVAPTIGPVSGGTNIRITGLEFATSATVTVAGAPATAVTVLSSSALTCVTPAGSAGTANIMVATTGGTSATTPLDVFTYTATTSAPAPTIGQVLQAYGPPSGGVLITITGSNLTSPASVTIGGMPAWTTTVVSGTQIIATTPPTTSGTQSVTIYTAAGPSASTSATSYLAVAPCGSVTATYYGGSSGTLGDDRRAATLSLIQAATQSITIATTNMSDPVILAALCTAATNGISVSMVEDLSNRSGPEPGYAMSLAASGGSVYNGPLPPRQANNFLTVDGQKSTSGSYYLSPTAVRKRRRRRLGIHR